MPLYGKNFEFDTLYESNFGGRAKKFGNILVYQIGEVSCVSGYKVPTHQQWCHELSYVISGEGVFSTNENASLLTAGDLHYCPNKAQHAIDVTGTSDLRFAYIGFSFDEGNVNNKEIEKLIKYFNTLKKYKASTDGKIEKIFTYSLDEFYAKSDYSAEMISCYLIQLLITAYRSFEEQPYVEYFPKLDINGSNRPIYLATSYIDRNIFENISVQDVAENIGYNFSYLSNAFKNATGLTISQYISNMKIQKSIDLMQNGKYSLSEISEKLNFASVQSFSRAFKRNTGKPPATFIKNNFKL